jgi:outer membrane protein assembly factor BamB
VAYFGSCGLFCYDLSGKELWKFELPPATIAGDLGTGTSPVIADGRAVLVRDEGQDPRIFAFDVATGKVEWKKRRRSPTSFSTPVVWDTPAGKQVVAAGDGLMLAYDLKTGEEKWSVAGVP